MTTFWTQPNKIDQYFEEGAEEEHISWGNLSKFPIQTNKDLFHIARSPKPNLKTKTYFLKFTKFHFENLPLTLSGIEFKLNAKRKGRITDETIQLYVNDKVVGDNKATLNLDPIKIYGNSTDKWGIDSLLISQISNLNFGVIVRFQSHPHWPHKDGAIIDLVELRIH